MLRWGTSSPVTASSAAIEEETTTSSSALNSQQQQQQQTDETTSSSSPDAQEPAGALLVDDESDEDDEDSGEFEDEDDLLRDKRARGDKRKRTREEEEASGSGHIEPDEDDDEADSEDMYPTWSPQNVQSTTEFTHIIADYANKRESGCKKAEYSDITVDDQGNRWRLIIYVNGNGRASNHHLSLFLQVADADDLPFGWKKSVSYVLTLEHPNGSTYSYAKRNPDKTFKLCPKAIDWGWSQFITSDRIQQEGFVSNDSLTVRASVSVKSSSVSIDEEDSELYLKCAVEEGDADAVELCLENGASVNCQFKDDLYTPLHTACSSGSSTGSMEVLEILLERGADCNACNKWRETPLLIAANNGHRLGVAALLKHGADPSLCSEAGWSALTFAAHKGYDDIVALLLRAGAPVNSRVSEDLSTPLHKACAGSKPGHLASVKLLLEAAADVHALNKWRETPLLTAANHGQAGAVEVLLSHGADPCKCTDTGWSPLSIAAYKGHDDVVRLLLEEGAPTEEDDPTLSALLQAATKGLPDTVELLLRHGADHTVTTKKGDTALSILVEQNLIDAAVEMVTHYNASIPRCSRDRKKVQRARLLINLRMKQLEREGNNLPHDDDDSENDGEGEATLAQHVANGQPDQAKPSSKKKKKKKGKNKMTAEAKAKAAEEELLMELEKEEEEARKEEAEANKKQAKNRKKKEKARQQKLKEEKERKEKEEAELKEKERLRKEREEKERKERIRKEEEAKERELKAMKEREKQMQLEKQKAKAKLKSQKVSPVSSKSQPTNSTPPAQAKNAKTKKASVVPVGQSTQAASISSAEGNRRWETKAKIQQQQKPPQASSPPKAPQTKMSPDSAEKRRLSGSSMVEPSNSGVSPSASMTASQNPSIQTPKAKPVAHQMTPGEDQFVGMNGLQLRKPGDGVEHPSVVVYRSNKVEELLKRSEQVQVVLSLPSVRKIMSRWIERAHHEGETYIDPIIPSWTDSEKSIAFFQRQFIAESRRLAPGAPMNMEALRSAGTALSSLCHEYAVDVLRFSHEVAKKIPPGASDTDCGLSYRGPVSVDDLHVISLNNQFHASLSASAVQALQKRYTGPPNKLLSVLFASSFYHDTMQMISSGTGVDLRLSPRTQKCLAAEMNVSVELHSEASTALPGNIYFGTFEEIDRFFGGKKPFTKGDSRLLRDAGGSCSVLLPIETSVASKYVSTIMDLIEDANMRRMPLSFVVFVSALSLHLPGRSVSRDELRQLDSRLETFPHSSQIITNAIHGYWSAGMNGSFVPSSEDTVLLLLQSEVGKQHYPIRESTIRVIIESMSDPAQQERQSPPPTLQTDPFHTDYDAIGQAPSTSPYFLTPDSSFNPNVFGEAPGAPQYATSASTELAPSLPFDFGRGAATTVPARRGRLFDLVDNDGEEDNSVDLVAGMLDKLDVGLFQNGGSVGGDNVDIEAISLMGINNAQQSQHSTSYGTSNNPFG